jgi:hypothetical protein
MTYSDEQIRSLVQRADQRERAARKRAIIYSLVPIVLAALLLWFASWLIQRTTRELDVVNDQLDDSQQELAAVNTQLTQANVQVGSARQELATVEAQLTQATTEIATLETEKATLQEQASTYQEEAERLRKESAKLQGQVDGLKVQVDDLERQVDQLNKSLESITEQLKLATDFQKYAYDGDWTTAVKYLASNYVDQSGLLLDLYTMQNVPWKLSGESPEEGFDSPGFAAYVLDTHGLLNAPLASVRYQSQLRETLPARPRSPRIGDLVFYALGYTMFYFEDEQGTPFVVGMTPVGVLALKPDFAQVIGYGAVY